VREIASQAKGVWDVPIRLETKDGQSVIELKGVIDISASAELKQLLVEALHGGQAVRIALAGATDLDVTAVELLWAAEREARGSGVSFSLAGPAPASILAALAEAGFKKFPVPAEVG
jgi:anti-anti-sigma regulatory factor